MSAMRVPTPTSHKVLRTPRVPEKILYRKADALRQSLIRQSGLVPGTYTTLDKDIFHRVSFVFEGLTANLTEAISRFDVADTCIALYTRHEEFLGRIEKRRYQSIPDIISGNPTMSTIEHQNYWRVASHLTESLRWLIEIAIKHCKSDGKKPSDSDIDWLLVIAWHLYEWDGLWEYVSHPVIPHQLLIKADFALSGAPTSRSKRAMNLYAKAMRSYTNESSRIWADSIMSPQKYSSIAEGLESIIEKSKLKPLSEAIDKERGYSLVDWALFIFGLIDSFKEHEYIKPIRIDKLSSFLHNWGIGPDRLSQLLTDYGLSDSTLSEVGTDKLLPVERARRDSRLVRRPIVVVQRNGRDLCIYGVETLTAAAMLFFSRLDKGRVELPDIVRSGPIRTSMGRIQTNLGNEFRDTIASKCTDALYTCAIEKSRVGREQIPQGKRFGPVDVFVVDRESRRFVLVEAKDITSEGIVPRLMKEEYDEFQKAIDKLQRQIAWFSDRVQAIKMEYHISPDEDYQIEGVIVVNEPRVWMYTSQEPLPIVGDIEFLRILKQGGKFHTVPAA